MLLLSVTSATPMQLGMSVDLSKLSLYDMSYSGHLGGVLRWGNGGAGEPIPSQCYDDTRSSCTNVFKKDVKGFTETKGAMALIKSETQIDASGSGTVAPGVTIGASLSVALSSSMKGSYFANSGGAFGVYKHLRKCHEIKYECMMGYTENDGLSINPEFKIALELLPKDTTGTNTEVMRQWSQIIIERFGTHLIKGTENGVALKMSSYMDHTGENVSKCAKKKVCAGLWAKIGAAGVGGGTGAGAVNITGCHSDERCNTANQDNFSWGQDCKAIGGEPLAKAKICKDEVTNEEMNAFLNSGDFESGDTVIGYKLGRLDDIAAQFGVDYMAALTFGKAIDYHLCLGQNNAGDGNAWAWQDGGCKCMRSCGLGGKLDEASCTCECMGDLNHGFKGSSCEEEWGQCQKGSGSGNDNGADRCPIDGTCNSWHNSARCSKSEVCCLTNYAGGCCPYGSTCDCGHDNCVCVLPEFYKTTTFMNEGIDYTTWGWSSTWSRTQGRISMREGHDKVARGTGVLEDFADEIQPPHSRSIETRNDILARLISALEELEEGL